jgi:hypothetical protein
MVSNNHCLGFPEKFFIFHSYVSILVGSVDAHDYVEALFLTCKHDPRVKSLGVEKVLAEAKHQHLLIQELSVDSQGWPGGIWMAQREIVDHECQVFCEKLTCLLDYSRSIKTISDVLKKKKQSDNRTPCAETI